MQMTHTHGTLQTVRGLAVLGELQTQLIHTSTEGPAVPQQYVSLLVVWEPQPQPWQFWFVVSSEASTFVSLEGRRLLRVGT